MANWLFTFIIVLASITLGTLIVLQFVPPRTRPTLEMAFAALTLGIGVTGWLGLLLAELGLFSLATLAAAWLTLLLLLMLLAWRRRRKWEEGVGDSAPGREPAPPLAGQWSRWLEAFVLLAWLVAASWLFFRPHEYIMGGADAGVYVSFGAEIAQQGDFRIVDETLAGLDQALYSATLRPLPANPVASSYLMPGFYVTNAEEGAITPQLYPLHPVWQAIAFSLSGSVVEGVLAELRVTGLWILLASLAIYLTVRELVGWTTAVLTLLALSITALQVWFARYPTTEALTQYLLWVGLWGLLMWLGDRRPSSLWAFLSGMALGSVFLVRIDVLIMLPIFLLLVVALWARGWRKSDYWFLGPFSLLVIHSFVHGLWFSAPYFYEHIGYGLALLRANWLIPLTVLFLGAIFLGLVYFFRGRFSVLGRYKRPTLLALIGLILLFAVYGWFIRPYATVATLRADAYSETLIKVTNHENWQRLGWYLFPVGIWLGVLGSCLLLWQVEWKTAALLAVGFLFSAVYLWNMRANPHHVYVMRRYVPAVVPFFLISTAFLIGWFFKQARARQGAASWQKIGFWGLGLILAIGWLFGLAWSARGFISQVDHEGVVDQLAAINDELMPGSVLIFYDQSVVGLGDFWGTPLKFIFGHDVFTLRDPNAVEDAQLAETLEFWQNNGRSVVWIGDPAWLVENGFRYHELIREIRSLRLESSYEHKPRAIVPDMWVLPMALIDQG